MSTPFGENEKGAAAGPRRARDSSSNNNSSGGQLYLPHDATTFDTADTAHDDPPDHHHDHEEAHNSYNYNSSSSNERAVATHSGSRPQNSVDDGKASRRVQFYSVEEDGDHENNVELPTRSPTRRQASSALSTSQSIHSGDNNINNSSNDPRKGSRGHAIISCGCWSDDAHHDLALQALYVSVFGIFGSVLRVYLGRFFGLDCQNAVSDDWFTRISDAVCVTANGKTDQTGGALFTDLPANMVGCFVMGLLSPSVLHGSVHPIPWFRQDHPLQRHPAFLLAIRVGLCGCLTTFASWNTQMVVMLDGTDTVLGSQVAAALVGYLMGVCTSVASFLCGRHAYDAWVTRHDPVLIRPDSAIDDVEGPGGVVTSHTCTSAASEHAMEQGAEIEGGGGTSYHSNDLPVKQDGSASLLSRFGRLWGFVAGIRVLPFLLVSGITAGFVVGDAVYGNLFYRKMWMCVVLSPLGALLRWHLSRYNSGGTGGRWDWVPWGTVAANMLAVIISVLAEALEDRYAVLGSPGYAWISAALPAVETGFAGSLSTVSTFVREMVDLHATPARMYLYGFGSLIFAMLLGLLIYSPIIRYL